VGPEVVERVMEFLRSYELLDDRKWAEAYTHDRLKRKLVSTKQLERELFQKGVTRSIVEDTLSKLESTNTEEERAREAALKKWKLLKRYEDLRERSDRLYRFLLSRGFSSAMSRKIAKELKSQIS